MSNLAQDEGKKPGLSSSFINIGVHSQSDKCLTRKNCTICRMDLVVNVRFYLDANVVFFRIKRTTQLKKLMIAYCDKRDRDIIYFEFLLDGHRIKGEQTPNELEMKDGDQIDALAHCDGGALA